MNSAEKVYFFKHAVMRDAAYQLHPPTERHRLHRLSYETICSYFDVVPSASMSKETELRMGSAWAELAHHSELAFDGLADTLSEVSRICHYYAARHDEREYRNRSAIAGYRRVAEHGQSSPEERSAAWLKIGDLERTLGGLSSAEAAYKRMQEVAESANLTHLVALALVLRGYSLKELGNWGESEKLLRRGVEVAREASEPLTLAKSLQIFASSFDLRGVPEQALPALKESIEIARAHGAVELLAESTRELGIALVYACRANEAEPLLRDAAQMFKRLKAGRQVVACEVGLGIAAAVTGRHESAVELFRGAYFEYVRFGAVRLAAGMLRYIATSLINLKQYEGASQALVESRDMLRELGDVPGVMNADFAMGTLALERGEYEAAEELFRALIVQASRTTDVYMLAICRSHLSEALTRLGCADEALHSADSALPVLHSTRNLRQGAYAEYTRAIALRALGRESDANSAFAKAVRLAQESGDQSLLGQIESGFAN